MYYFEFDTKKDKNPGWYMTAAVVCLVLIVWGVYTGIYALPLVILVLVGVYSLIENNSPDKLGVEITENGIMVGDMFYDYPKIDSFCVIYKRNIPMFLRLNLNSGTFKTIDIPIDKIENLADIKSYLLNFLEESKNTALSGSDSLINYLKL